MEETSEENVRVVTLGCRLNTHESEVMKALAEKAGLKNAIIVNTCAVTTEAERQARQKIRSLKRMYPDAYLIATGCAVQMRPEAFAQMSAIDRVLGNDIKLKEESFHPDFPYRAKVGSMKAVSELDLPLVARFKGKAKAFLQIQNGCNHHCTFCTIPLARGKSRSVPFGAIVEQIHALLEGGIQEVILTGVDLTSYGYGLPGQMTLGQMIKRLLIQIPSLKRLRLSSVDSVEIDSELYALLCSEPRILPHLHLSLQAGDNFILKRMRRRHTREQAIALCKGLHKERPDFVFGADFIVGFPGESEEMFLQTQDLVEACELTHLHVFPFSQRPGTPAARMSDQVSKGMIKERADRLRAQGCSRLEKLFAQHQGKKLEVLVEQPTKGYSNDFSCIRFLEEKPINQVISAHITHYDENCLWAV